ncbi:MAG: DUF4328 domain-containing protein [Blastocatellia bacterium]
MLKIATIVVFLIWEHRSFSNLSSLKARNLEFSPGWAVGWWFIPFANLIKPYQAMKELWRESDPDYDENLGFLSSNLGVPTFFGFWWALWIISNIAGRIAERASDEPGGGVSSAFPFIFLVASVLSIAAAGLLILVVRDINERQEERFKRLGIEINDVPPPPTFGNAA